MNHLPAQLNSPGALDALLRERRTIHEFRPEPVPPAEIAAALELAIWVPNHHHTEPWRFYLLGPESAARVNALNAAIVRATKGEEAANAKQRRWAAMPGWLVITCARHADAAREREDYAACCCAAHNFALALWARGIGCKWSTGKVLRDPGFLPLIEADPEQEFPVGLFWFGYPLEVPRQARTTAAEFTRALA